MFEVTRTRAKSAATIGVAAALVVGGVAAAQNDSQGGSEGDHAAKAGKRPPPPGTMGPPLKGLTYGELHVQDKEGNAEVIRLDQGKIVSVDASSITLSENDGSEATVALDEDTDVIAGPPAGRGHNRGGSTVDDLSKGQQVLVSGPEGEAAKAVMAVPKKGDLKGGRPGGQLPPPPPGAQMGS